MKPFKLKRVKILEIVDWVWKKYAKILLRAFEKSGAENL
jgi:hypothetical protein